MDSITHIALGACIGELFLGKRIGKKAMLLGAIAQSVPDIDFIAGLWMSPSGNLLAHRGFTHSFLFAVLVTLLLALLAQRWLRPHNIFIRTWLLFFGVQVFGHILLDAFNAYGTGWFEPFSHARISFNTIFVADPFFSIWIGAAFLALLILKRHDRKRSAWARFGLVMSALYLFYCIHNKVKTDRYVEDSLAARHISYENYFTSPTAFNNWLWYVVVKAGPGFYIGYRSVFDDDQPVSFRYFPEKDILLNPVRDHEDLQQLKRFSKGYYTVEYWHDTLVFNDLRFGQTAGWRDAGSRFTFHYYLQHRDDNRMIVQRGRFESWNRDVLESLMKRIEGNQDRKEFWLPLK